MHGSRPALLLHPALRLSPEQFALVCEANPDAVLELAADGQLIRLSDGSVLSPDLVVELVSPSDEGPRGAEALLRKLAAYRANGAQLGGLIAGPRTASAPEAAQSRDLS